MAETPTLSDGRIRIERVVLAARTGTPGKEVVSVCDEVFALHEGPLSNTFVITHRPTGYSVRNNVTWREALETLREIYARGLDFGFTDPAEAAPLANAMAEINGIVRARLHDAEDA